MHVSSMNRHVSSICAGGQYLFRQTGIEVIVFRLVQTTNFRRWLRQGPPTAGVAAARSPWEMSAGEGATASTGTGSCDTEVWDSDA
jgi:hypothetical protein